MARDGVILGLDLGTTATKVVGVRANAEVVCVVERRYPLVTDEEGQAEQDPTAVLAAVLDGLAEAVGACVAGGHDVVGLALTGGMHTLLGLADGDPVTPAFSWADTRSAETAIRLRSDPRTARLHMLTGTPVHSMSPMVRLRWLGEHEPTLWGRVRQWCGVKDWVLSRLTGRLVVDHSFASGTGLLDMSTLDWSPEALALAGVDAERLPELVAPTEVLALSPEIAGRVGLTAGLPVVAGLGDGPAANLGVGAIRPGMAAISLGTSGALRVVVDKPNIDEAGRLFCYALADGLWVTGGAISNGGLVVQWLSELFEPMDIATLLAEADQVPSGAEGLVALPYLIGERAPYWDSRPAGLLLGLRRHHRRAHVTRAVIEGVANQLALVWEAIAQAGVEVNEVRVTGGVFRAPVWSKVIAAAVALPVALAEDNEGSGLGAALLGWRALGVIDSLAGAAELIRCHGVVEPEATAVIHQRQVLETVRAAYAIADGFAG